MMSPSEGHLWERSGFYVFYYLLTCWLILCVSLAIPYSAEIKCYFHMYIHERELLQKIGMGLQVREVDCVPSVGGYCLNS